MSALRADVCTAFFYKQTPRCTAISFNIAHGPNRSASVQVSDTGPQMSAHMTAVSGPAMLCNSSRPPPNERTKPSYVLDTANPNSSGYDCVCFSPPEPVTFGRPEEPTSP
jgi:hypothetical protein